MDLLCGENLSVLFGGMDEILSLGWLPIGGSHELNDISSWHTTFGCGCTSATESTEFTELYLMIWGTLRCVPPHNSVCWILPAKALGSSIGLESNESIPESELTKLTEMCACCISSSSSSSSPSSDQMRINVFATAGIGGWASVAGTTSGRRLSAIQFTYLILITSNEQVSRKVKSFSIPKSGIGHFRCTCTIASFTFNYSLHSIRLSDLQYIQLLLELNCFEWEAFVSGSNRK